VKSSILQGDANGINFDKSRDYVDNNHNPALGSRMTIGNQFVKVGGSVMGGRFANYPNAPPVDSSLSYTIFDADLTVRYHNLVRIQCEHAQPDTDRVLDPSIYPTLSMLTIDRESVGGGYLEAEVLLSRTYKIGALARYDNQSQRSVIPPPESGLATGHFGVSRYT
jgi:hypothetical protein